VDRKVNVDDWLFMLGLLDRLFEVGRLAHDELDRNATRKAFE
jgi:hypothetical protein